jgi:hypothetical protein
MGLPNHFKVLPDHFKVVHNHLKVLPNHFKVLLCYAGVVLSVLPAGRPLKNCAISATFVWNPAALVEALYFAKS